MHYILNLEDPLYECEVADKKTQHNQSPITKQETFDGFDAVCNKLYNLDIIQTVIKDL